MPWTKLSAPLVFLSASLIFLFALLFVFYNYSVSGYINPFYQDPEKQHIQFPIWRLLASALVMLLGIAFGAVYNGLQDGAGPVTASQLWNLLRSRELIRSILTAPIVFAGVYAAAKQEPDYVVASLLAFQNGFFCESIFRRKAANDAASQR